MERFYLYIAPSLESLCLSFLPVCDVCGAPVAKPYAPFSVAMIWKTTS